MTKEQRIQNLVNVLVDEAIVSAVENKVMNEADLKERFTAILSRLDEFQPNPATKHWNS